MTAHSPYLNKVTKANASIIEFRLLKSKPMIATHKNNEAIGLSGTKGRKYHGVLTNWSPYHIKPYIVPHILQMSKNIKQVR
ncbi:hypothetical protein SPETJ133_13610 [Staphylococcus petrasii]